MHSLIAYHDRTKHTGCIYRKAGFRKDGVSQHVGVGWGNRPGRVSAALENTPKRRWRLLLADRKIETPLTFTPTPDLGGFTDGIDALEPRDAPDGL